MSTFWWVPFALVQPAPQPRLHPQCMHQALFLLVLASTKCLPPLQRPSEPHGLLQLPIAFYLLSWATTAPPNAARACLCLASMRHPARPCTTRQLPLCPQSRGADPRIRTENYDPYLDPGCKTPREVAIEDDEIQDALAALEDKYAHVPRVREPHPDIGCWWALYDYGQDAIGGWAKDHIHPYPGVGLVNSSKHALFCWRSSCAGLRRQASCSLPSACKGEIDAGD